MDDLVAFYAARLDEDEAAAKAALPGPWMTGRARDHLADNVVYGQSRDWPGHIVQVCNVDYGHNKVADSDHIARYDPARALRAVEAGRRILARYEDCLARMEDPDYAAGVARDQAREYEDFVLPNLVAKYDGHPDYRQEWKP